MELQYTDVNKLPTFRHTLLKHGHRTICPVTMYSAKYVLHFNKKKTIKWYVFCYGFVSALLFVFAKVDILFKRLSCQLLLLCCGFVSHTIYKRATY